MNLKRVNFSLMVTFCVTIMIKDCHFSIMFTSTMRYKESSYTKNASLPLNTNTTGIIINLKFEGKNVKNSTKITLDPTNLTVASTNLRSLSTEQRKPNNITKIKGNSSDVNLLRKEQKIYNNQKNNDSKKINNTNNSNPEVSLRSGHKYTPHPLLMGRPPGWNGYQFVASIRKIENRTRPHGTGTIIGSRWILTTRRVVVTLEYDSSSRQAKVKTFHMLNVYPKYSDKFSTLTRFEGYDVEKTFCFPFHWQEDRATDYPALLKLRRAIPLNGESAYNFRKIDLISANFDPQYDDEFKIAGWSFSREPPLFLPTFFQVLTTKTIPVEHCQDEQDDKELDDVVEFCTEGFGGIFCEDLSGSPVTKIAYDGRQLLAGYLAFFGKECG